MHQYNSGSICNLTQISVWFFASYLKPQLFSTLHNCYSNSEGATGHTEQPQKVKGTKEEDDLGERHRWFKSLSSALASPTQVPRDLPGALLEISHPFAMAEKSGPKKGIIEYSNLCFNSYIFT